MTKLPYLPLFVDDFFGGTLRWDGEKQSLYALLLMHQWASGPLPKDPAEIAEAIHYDNQRFKKLWDAIKKKFELTSEGWVNVRLEEVRAHSLEIANERSRAGKKGVEAKAKLKQEASRRQANEQAIAEANAKSNGQANVSVLKPICSSIQSNPIQSEEVRGLPGGKVV